MDKIANLSDKIVFVAIYDEKKMFDVACNVILYYVIILRTLETYIDFNVRFKFSQRHLLQAYTNSVSHFFCQYMFAIALISTCQHKTDQVIFAQIKLQKKFRENLTFSKCVVVL